MAMPSAVTIGSLAFVLAAGVGYVVVSAASADQGATPSVAPPTHSTQVTVTPSKPVATPDHSEPPAHRKPDAVPHVLVVVFNNTGVSGLAEQKAAILQGAGWQVAATDNWYGDIPADTVYYPPALRKEAGQLAKVLHITRLHPAVAPMQFDRLTVIIATAP
jgi:hypothetical protein